jgi:hypothetical protein
MWFIVRKAERKKKSVYTTFRSVAGTLLCRGWAWVVVVDVDRLTLIVVTDVVLFADVVLVFHVVLFADVVLLLNVIFLVNVLLLLYVVQFTKVLLTDVLLVCNVNILLLSDVALLSDVVLGVVGDVRVMGHGHDSRTLLKGQCGTHCQAKTNTKFNRKDSHQKIWLSHFSGSAVD